MELLKYLGFELFQLIAVYIGKLVLRVLSVGRVKLGVETHWLNALAGMIGWIVILILIGTVFFVFKAGLSDI